ncbi:MAG: SusC/RagA family TonB-linked outer membrane protein [Pedobacter sp.]|nr:MAG: SusC/RagA family TonB-linked outer membrane protein [Pedobacter sp.]
MRRRCMVFFMLLISSCASAQINFKGRLVDVSTGAGIEAATLLLSPDLKVKTSSDGIFQVMVPKGRYRLELRHLLYQTKVVALYLHRDTSLSLQMLPIENSLDSVVVMSTGYQKISLERSTGSFAALSKAQLDRRVGTNIIDRLQDEVSGLILNRKGNSAITIRGMSTISSDASPLIILDNFPFEGDLGSINPNDIEQVTVLKDAAAASIWGARAGNGVIVIDTKKAKKQGLQLGLNHNQTVALKPNISYERRISPEAYIGIERTLFDRGFYQSLEQGVARAPMSPAIELMILNRDGKIDRPELERQLNLLAAADVRKEYREHFMRNTYNRQFSMNLQGGSKINRFYIGTGMDKNSLDEIGNSFDRFNLKLNNVIDMLSGKLLFHTDVQVNYTKRVMNNPGLTALTLGATYPYADLIGENGNSLALMRDYRSSYLNQLAIQYPFLLDWTYRPYQEIELNDHMETALDLRLNANLSYIIGKGLKLDLFHQYSQLNSRQNFHRSQDTYYVRNLINNITQINPDGSYTRPIPLGGILDRNYGRTVSNNSRLQLAFNTNLNHNFKVNAFAGIETKDGRQLIEADRLYGYDVEHETSKAVDYLNSYRRLIVNNSNALIENVNSRRLLTDRFLSYFSNAQLIYKDRYVATASARFDQSNIFGVNTNQKGVPLWSVGVKWLLDREGFYSGLVDKLHLRASYGHSGNVNRNLSAYATAVYNQGTGNSNNWGTRMPYGVITNPPNPELRWERIRTFNVGIDFATKANRIDGIVEYYLKNGYDLIGSTAFAPSTGISTFTGNNASTRTAGLDLTLNTKNLIGRFAWSTTFLLSYNRERVTDYGIPTTATDYIQTGNNLAKPFIGHPLFALYSYTFAGLDSQTGDPLGYLDGVVSKDYQRIISTATPQSINYHGSARPTAFGVLRNQFRYARIILGFSVNYRLGYYFRHSSIRYGNDNGLASSHADYLDRWQRTGDELWTNIPAVPSAQNTNRDNFYQYSDILVDRADHIRLQDINLAYEFDVNKMKLRGIRAAQIYFYANNLGLIWTKSNRGIDPDYQTGPLPLSLSLGLRIDF